MLKVLYQKITLILLVSISVQSTNAKDSQIETVIEGLNFPWAVAFLPNTDMLITELDGQLRLVKNGALLEQAIRGVPDVYRAGQGGLMDVMVDRDFANNQHIYLSYAHGERGANATRLMRARLVNGALLDQQVIFTASPLKATPHHYAARMAQMADGTILLTVGDGFNYREQAQKLNNHFGKIIRIHPDGSIPNDNPYVGQSDAKPEIWSYGHRNQQAIVVSSDGTVYANEHGPQGGDEINLIQPGNNYGWPVITYGIDYNGAQITPFTQYAGMQQPLVNWTPSIAPSGMTEWQGDLYTVSLKQKSVRRVQLANGKLVSDQRVFPKLEVRLRDIRSGPDGALYILTDGKDGKLLRISN